MTRRIRTSDRNIPWLAAIPEHWGIVRAKALFRPRKELARPGDQQLSATQSHGVIPQKDYEKQIGRKVTQITRHLEKRRHVERDDFVISMRSFQGGLERAWAAGCIRSSYVVLEPSATVDVGYFSYLFKSHDYIQALRATANFIRDGQDLNFNNFCLVDLPFPPPDEQAAIVRFLDHVDRRIRRYIRAKRKLIALLNEQKQAIIHRAVTRGLDPNVRLKPSGVEWLGDVPEHWEVEQLRRRWKVTDCKHLTVPFVDDGIPLASVREVQSFDLNLATAKRTTQEWYEHLIGGGRKPCVGDLIYCRNVSVGACAEVRERREFAMGQDVCLISSVAENNRYLNYLLHSELSRIQLKQLLIGSTFNRINVAEIKSLIVVVPPRVEQDAIVSFLDAELPKLEGPVECGLREIDLLREYRTRLIADVVTGKLDVREAAARLPDEPSEADEPDAVEEELLDADEAAGEVDLDAEPEEVVA